MNNKSRKILFIIFLLLTIIAIYFTAIKSSGNPKSRFISPLIKKDQQYTFYLSEYHSDNPENPFTNPLTNTNLNLYFMTEADCPAIELTFLSLTNSITRKLLDPCKKFNPSGDLPASSGSFQLGNYSFAYRSDTFPVNNFTLLIARSLFAPTRIALAASDGKQIPDQGEYVPSSKNYRSYPQIPAEFFVTSF